MGARVNGKLVRLDDERRNLPAPEKKADKPAAAKRPLRIILDGFSQVLEHIEPVSHRLCHGFFI